MSIDTTNPKDAIGITKPNVFMVPMISVYEMAKAFEDGVAKYGLFNWREKDVRADIYIEACRRHVNAWVAKEELAPDSGAHHLGHAMACLAILIDAQANGTMIDNRVADPALLKWMINNTGGLKGEENERV